MNIPAYIAIPIIILIVYLFTKWLRKFLYKELWHARYDKDMNFKSPIPDGKIQMKIRENKLYDYLKKTGDISPEIKPPKVVEDNPYDYYKDIV